MYFSDSHHCPEPAVAYCRKSGLFLRSFHYFLSHGDKHLADFTKCQCYYAMQNVAVDVTLVKVIKILVCHHQTKIQHVYISGYFTALVVQMSTGNITYCRFSQHRRLDSPYLTGFLSYLQYGVFQWRD